MTWAELLESKRKVINMDISGHFTKAVYSGGIKFSVHWQATRVLHNCTSLRTPKLLNNQKCVRLLHQKDEIAKNSFIAVFNHAPKVSHLLSIVFKVYTLVLRRILCFNFIFKLFVYFSHPLVMGHMVGKEEIISSYKVSSLPFSGPPCF